MTWIDSGPQAVVVAGVVGGLAGWGVGAGVPWLMRHEGLPAVDAAERVRPAYAALVGAVAAVALWWWEAVAGGLVPVTTVPAVADGTVTTVRWLGHVVLVALLAAAS